MEIAKIKQIALKAGQAVAFKTADIIRIDAKKLPFNKGNLEFEVKMRPSSSITGEFISTYSKISTLLGNSLFKMVNIKGIPIQLDDATTLAGNFKMLVTKLHTEKNAC